MTKRQTRMFFYGGTGFFSLVFLVLTVDTHRQVDRLTNANRITPEVVEGKHVWHRKNCINCHTILGEGAYYAPDLTKITDLRGEAYPGGLGFAFRAGGAETRERAWAAARSTGQRGPAQRAGDSDPAQPSR